MALKYRKLRRKAGYRSCGRGSHKKNRGAGNRGGKGMAGTHKGKYTWVVKYAPNYFGRHGFKLPEGIRNIYKSINIGELDEIASELLAEGISKVSDDGIEIDITVLGCKKVLGKGKVTRNLVIKAPIFSRTAVEKIEKAGGKAVILE
ncbi:50S ribosomal protein L15P [archaeon]|nr:50S ribosomal protein L15P [archaeon]